MIITALKVIGCVVAVLLGCCLISFSADYFGITNPPRWEDDDDE